MHGMYNIQLTDSFVRPIRKSRCTFRPTSTGNYMYHLSVSYTWRCLTVPLTPCRLPS